MATLRTRISGGLDQLYGTHVVSPQLITAMSGGDQVIWLTRGPDGAAYMISTDRSVLRVDPATGRSAVIVTAGEGSGVGMGPPYVLGVGGPDLLIIDTRGALWRWRPSDDQGNGTLGSIRVGGDVNWGHDVPDIGTFVINADRGLYRLYVAHPPSQQILRYEPVADGSSFIAPTPYFLGESEPVSSFRRLFIDGDIYALTGDNVLRYFNGRRVTSYALADPPDGEDVRPGHDYQQFAGTGLRTEAGRLYVWDATHKRVLVFNKDDGAYIEQFVADGAEFDDVRGMYVADGAAGQPSALIFATAGGLYSVALDSTPVDAANAGAVGQRPLQPAAIVGPVGRARRIARRLAVAIGQYALHARPASPELKSRRWRRRASTRWSSKASASTCSRPSTWSSCATPFASVTCPSGSGRGRPTPSRCACRA